MRTEIDRKREERSAASLLSTLGKVSFSGRLISLSLLSHARVVSSLSQNPSSYSTLMRMASSNPVTRFQSNPPESRTFARQHELPKLPIPSLEDTCNRYLTALEGLQDQKEHEGTKRAVEEFLNDEGPRIQERLKAYAADKAR